MVTRSGVMLVAGVLGVATFAAVQDRVTASAARRYAAEARTAVAEGRVAPVVENEMAPAIRRSVRWGAAAAGVVVLLGFGAALTVRKG